MGASRSGSGLSTTIMNDDCVIGDVLCDCDWLVYYSARSALSGLCRFVCLKAKQGKFMDGWQCNRFVTAFSFRCNIVVSTGYYDDTCNVVLNFR